MQQAVLRFLGSLDTEQKAAAMGAFRSPERIKWSYLPGPRPGLPLAVMTSGQQELALALLDTGCSMVGHGESTAITSRCTSRSWTTRSPSRRASWVPSRPPFCLDRTEVCGCSSTRRKWGGRCWPDSRRSSDRSRTNHIHSVWRDLRNDWGDDLLARHYADHH
jgi:Protein of unknown function (DUF3500)